MTERGARDVQRGTACIDTVKQPNALCNTAGPSPTSTSCVEAFRMRAEPVKVEDTEVLFEEIVELASDNCDWSKRVHSTPNPSTVLESRLFFVTKGT